MLTDTMKRTPGATCGGGHEAGRGTPPGSRPTMAVATPSPASHGENAWHLDSERLPG
jgi:hypothetical protein